MANKKRKETNFNDRRKQISKPLINKVKQFISRPKNVALKTKNRKLFSLQHQTLSILRKADKYQIKQKRKSLDELSKIMKHIGISDEDCSRSGHCLENFTGRKQKKIKRSSLENCSYDSQESKRKNSSKVDYVINNTDIEIENTPDSIIDSEVSFEALLRKVKKGKLSKHEELFFASDNLNMDEDTEVSKHIDDESENAGTGNRNFSRGNRVKELSKKIKKRSKRSLSHSSCEDNQYSDLSVFPNSKPLDCKDERYLEGTVGTSTFVASHEDGGLILNNPYVDFYQYNTTNVLLTLLHPCSLCFIGILKVEVLIGSVDVLGFNLRKSSGKHTLYSLKGLSNLCIATKESENFDDSTVKILSSYGIPKDKLDSFRERFNKNIVMLILSNGRSDVSSEVRAKFIEKYSEHSLLPQVNLERSVNAIEDTLQCTFELYSRDTPRMYKEMRDWNSIFNHVKSGLHRLVVCGGKGVGKSTLLRYLINRYLSLGDKVLVVDFDPGQSEFMVPGCVSAFVVTSPLLGPSFTHILDPIRSVFFGLVDVAQGVEHYLDCVQNVVDYCKAQDDLRNIPWFVNMMGFNKGVGVPITSSVIKKIKPSVLVQIKSEHSSQNYPSILSPEYVEKSVLPLSKLSLDLESLNYEVILTDSAVVNIWGTKKNKKRQADAWGLSAPSLRNIMILSYFGQLLNSKVKDIYEAEPYVVDTSNIYVEILKESLDKSGVLDVINGNLVALCCQNKTTSKVNTCYGFGIVRAVNMETKQLYLLTPLKEEILRHVNCLIKGSIALPSSLYCNPGETVAGHVPYVNISNNILSRTVKKTFKKVHD